MTSARLLERLEATDVASLHAGGVSARLRDLARLKGCIAGIEAELARRANQLADALAGAASKLDGGDRALLFALDAELAALVTADRATDTSDSSDADPEGGWQLDLDPITRELTVRLVDGTVVSRSRPGLAAAARSSQAPPGLRQPTRVETATTVGEVA